MTVEIVRAVLGWMSVINLGILTGWFLSFVFARNLIYQLHTRWFGLSVTDFDVVHYSGMAYYKIAIFLFNLTPFLALQLVV